MSLERPFSGPLKKSNCQEKILLGCVSDEMTFYYENAVEKNGQKGHFQGESLRLLSFFFETEMMGEEKEKNINWLLETKIQVFRKLEKLTDDFSSVWIVTALGSLLIRAGK